MAIENAQAMVREKVICLSSAYKECSHKAYEGSSYHKGYNMLMISRVIY
jgi:hypothetical protein